MARLDRSATSLVCATLVVAASVAPPTVAGQAPSAGAQPFRPWIESRAPEAFTPTALAPGRRAEIRYQADAQLLLPLLITSVGLAWKRDVGFATVSYRDYPSRAGGTIRAFEFFGTSVPERSRGVDRMGFFREAHALGDRAGAWCVYFGAMTASPEQSYEEARRTATEKRDVHGYEVIDGMVDRKESRSQVFRLTSSKRSASASALYGTLRPPLERERPTTSRTVPVPSGFIPLSFLGGVDASVRAVAMSGASRAIIRQPFMYHGKLRTLELLGQTGDAARGRAYMERGLVTRAEAVRRLDYRIMEGSGERARFRVWIDASHVVDHAAMEPVFPLAFEYQPRSFLRLRFERTK